MSLEDASSNIWWPPRALIVLWQLLAPSKCDALGRRFFQHIVAAARFECPVAAASAPWMSSKVALGDCWRTLTMTPASSRGFFSRQGVQASRYQGSAALYSIALQLPAHMTQRAW
eukprot:1157771-Pelagomonas_calceolata.AAC.2